jgi:hypothetical protein
LLDDISIKKAPLNGITAGQAISDNINQMITLAGCFFIVVYIENGTFEI